MALAGGVLLAALLVPPMRSPTSAMSLAASLLCTADLRLSTAAVWQIDWIDSLEDITTEYQGREMRGIYKLVRVTVGLNLSQEIKCGYIDLVGSGIL